MEPSLRARSPIPHIHGGDRTHPSVHSLHAVSESLRSHCSALSEDAQGHAGSGLRKRTVPAVGKQCGASDRRGLGGDMELWTELGQGAAGAPLQLEMKDGPVKYEVTGFNSKQKKSLTT